jgi:3',5'-cyclic AMP phosphodiesterase CpdA
MKIAITSDLHFGLTSPGDIADMLGRMQETEAPDTLIVAGDLGEPFRNFVGCLDILVGSGIPQIGVVAGNHDVWRSAKISSAELFEERMPAACREHGIAWLEDDSLILTDGTAVCGSMAWYDYSDLAEPHRSWAQKKKGRYVKDAVYIDWSWTDEEVAARCRNKLLKRLQACQDNPEVKRIVLATHIPIFAEQLVRHPGDDPTSSAYFKNLVTGDAILNAEISKLRYVASGHTHREVKWRPLVREVNEILVATLASDYYSPQWTMIETSPVQ